VVDPWGHSIVKSIKVFREDNIAADLGKTIEQARELYKSYIITKVSGKLTLLEVYVKKEA